MDNACQILEHCHFMSATFEGKGREDMLQVLLDCLLGCVLCRISRILDLTSYNLSNLL